MPVSACICRTVTPSRISSASTGPTRRHRSRPSRACRAVASSARTCASRSGCTPAASPCHITRLPVPLWNVRDTIPGDRESSAQWAGDRRHWIDDHHRGPTHRRRTHRTDRLAAAGARRGRLDRPPASRRRVVAATADGVDRRPSRRGRRRGRPVRHCPRAHLHRRWRTADRCAGHRPGRGRTGRACGCLTGADAVARRPLRDDGAGPDPTCDRPARRWAAGHRGPHRTRTGTPDRGCARTEEDPPCRRSERATTGRQSTPSR